MVVAQHLGQLFNGSVRQLLSQCRADNAGVPRLGGNTLHDGGVRSNDDVVLIHAPRVVAFGFQHTNDAHWDRLETDGLANGVVAIEQLLDDGGANDADLGGLLDVLVSKAVATLHAPLLDVEIVGRLAIHRCRGIVVAVDGLTRGGDLGRDLRHKLLFAQNALVVSLFQRLHG